MKKDFTLQGKKSLTSFISWNVNSIRARATHIETLMATHSWDVLALQETKVEDKDFPQDLFLSKGLHLSFWGEKAYNGVAVISKWPITKERRWSPLDNPQARCLQVTLEGPKAQPIELINVYIPNGREVGHLDYQKKIAYLQAFSNFVRPWIFKPLPTLILGDINVALSDDDVHDPLFWRDQILCSLAERQKIRHILGQGWTDGAYPLSSNPCTPSFPQKPETFENKPRNFLSNSRKKSAPPSLSSHDFTWWPYKGYGWENQRGLRIDYAFLSPWAADRLSGPVQGPCQARVLSSWRSKESPSDHAPLEVFLDLENKCD